MNNTEKFCLIGKIKGLAKQAQHTRSLLVKAKKQERVWSLCAIKRGIGIDARHHLLAYGMLKGIPYRMMEAKCRKDNVPSSQSILTVITGHVPYYLMDGKLGPAKYTLESVAAWLADTSYTPTAQPKREKRPYVKPASREC